ncbi:MAG: GyrI-like domain-containing protein [Chloroflexi bacterium]|nr:GyrI-like domain-containing protein [Chloroflexota bacterium]
MPAKKLDLKQQFRHLYEPSPKQVTVVDVPPLNYLMIDGAGDPNSAIGYKQAVEALYSLAYRLKFLVKKEQGTDYAVMPLEGLWWTPDMATFSVENKDEWLWTMLILQPEFVTAEQVEAARAEVARKKDVPALPLVRLERYHEGLSVQILHIGPYAAEAPTIERMHAFIQKNGWMPGGKHHEIYLSDPTRTASDKLKTVLRQPVRAVEQK